MTATAAEPGTLEVVSFMAGGYRFAVEAAQVRTQLPAARTATLPTPVPVEQFLGLSSEGTQNLSSRRILLMKHPAGDYAVTVSDPVELHRLDIATIHPLPVLIAARTTLTGLRGLALAPEGMMALVDFRECQIPQ